jgi:hypothetical protein
MTRDRFKALCKDVMQVGSETQPMSDIKNSVKHDKCHELWGRVRERFVREIGLAKTSAFSFPRLLYLSMLAKTSGGYRLHLSVKIRVRDHSTKKFKCTLS